MKRHLAELKANENAATTPLFAAGKRTRHFSSTPVGGLADYNDEKQVGHSPVGAGVGRVRVHRAAARSTPCANGSGAHRRLLRCTSTFWRRPPTAPGRHPRLGAAVPDGARHH